MKLYIKYSAWIYGIYLKYVAKEDIHVYSVDEAFLDVTDYLSMYQTDARSLAQRFCRTSFPPPGLLRPAASGRICIWLRLRSILLPNTQAILSGVSTSSFTGRPFGTTIHYRIFGGLGPVSPENWNVSVFLQ